MGLLDIWNDWRKETGYFQDSSSNLQTMAQDSDTIDRNKINKNRNVGVYPNQIGRQNVDQALQKRGLNARSLIQDPKNAQTKINAAQQANVTPTDPITQGGVGTKQGEDPSWWQGLANKFNSKFNMEDAMKHWKDKGGFEGLMANPAFTMGLAFMQAGAEGKTLGQGALDNVMKAAGISSHYKQIIEDRKQEPIQATAADIDEVKTMLDRVKLKEPNIWEKAVGWIKGDNVTAKYDRAAEAVAIAYQEEIANMQRKHKGTKPFVINEDVKEKALLKVLKDKRVKQKDGWAIFGPLTSGTIQMDNTLSDYKFKAEGGPVKAGKPYVVGEKGPEIIIPTSDGEVLSNDDSQIYAMLLASNPQLQKVSRARAEKILRSRFPEYFE